MDPTTHTPGQLRVTPLRDSLSPLCEFSQSLKNTMYSFEAGDGICGEAVGRPEKIGFSFTAVMTASDAARLKRCWDSHDALVESLRHMVDSSVALPPDYDQIECDARTLLHLVEPKPQPDTEESELERDRLERKGDRA